MTKSMSEMPVQVLATGPTYCDRGRGCTQDGFAYCPTCGGCFCRKHNDAHVRYCSSKKARQDGGHGNG